MGIRKTLLAIAICSTTSLTATSALATPSLPLKTLAITHSGTSTPTHQTIDQYVEQLDPIRQQRIERFNDVIQNHLNQNFSIVRTVRILTTHYPRDVREILLAAYQQEPNYIAVISRAVIRSEPAFTTDVLDTAFAVAPSHYESLVKMAIEAEPAYIDDIVAVAAQHQPEHLNTIVRIAITAEPDFSGSVVRSAAMSSPKHFFSAMVDTIKSIPESTKNVFAAIKDFFTGEEPASEPLPKSQPEQWQQFIAQAKRSGVTREEMEWFKEQGYISEQQLAAVYNQQD